MNYTYILIAGIYFVISFIFSVSGGHGTIIRALFFTCGIPADIALASIQASAVANRIGATVVAIQKKLIDRKMAIFIGIISIIAGFGATYILLVIDVEIVEFIIGILLVIGAILFFAKKFRKKEKKNSITTYIETKVPYAVKKGISIILLVFGETVSVITGGGGLIGNTVLMKYFGKTALQASAIRKLGNIAKAGITVIGFYIAGIYDIEFILYIIPAGLLGTILGIHFFSKKSDTVNTYIIAIMSIGIGSYLVRTGIQNLFLR